MSLCGEDGVQKDGLSLHGGGGKGVLGNQCLHFIPSESLKTKKIVTSQRIRLG